MSRNLLCVFFVLLIGCKEKHVFLFEERNAEDTGIYFTNTVKNTEQLNIITFRNFYNGGGVSIGDINNDGLNDIYFTSNMAENKLYLNEGEFKFKDITESSGTAGSDSWTNGTTFVDINKDGLLDIYVCHSGVVQNTSAQNELFINQGDNTFHEEASKYGLADDGFSTQAAFLDYDLDGDLDCYLLNNSLENPDKLDLYNNSREIKDALGGDRFYENVNGVYHDVTDKAGIYSSKIGFGLGVSVGYLNDDRYPDIYVSNDFWEKDYLYLNTGKGAFKESLSERVETLSLNSMGGDIGDINNDGHFDMINTDMLPSNNDRIKRMTAFDSPQAFENKRKQGYHQQLLQNSLQLNDGQGNFQEVANMTGLAATDWSWGALIFDFSLDGREDIFVSNGIYQDLTDFDFVTFIEDKQGIAEMADGKASFGINDIIAQMPSSPLKNYGFLNQGNLSFRNASSEIGFNEPSFSNGSAYGDLDNDGDLDLVVNNINSEASVYRNTTIQNSKRNYIKILRPSKDGLSIGLSVQIFTQGKTQKKQIFGTKGFQSSTPFEIVFGLDTLSVMDSLWINWPDGTYESRQGPMEVNRTLEISKSTTTINSVRAEGAPNYMEIEGSQLLENNYSDFNTRPLSLHDFSAKGPKILKGDVNGDGLIDFIILAPHDEPNVLFLQNGHGGFEKAKSLAFELDKGLEANSGALFDADGDGDLDLLVGHGGNEFQRGPDNFKPRYYENNGLGDFTFRADKSPQATGNFGTIKTEDFDKDGDMDVFLGASLVPGNYGLVPASFLFANNGDGTWQNRTNETFGTLGMVSDAAWSDYDKDGFTDLIVVGEFMPITIIKNEMNVLQHKIEIAHSTGLWQCISKVDLDKDGRDDYLLGNWGLNSKLEASKERPLTLYVGDFGGNKKQDALLVNYNKGDTRPFPFYSKMVLQESFPFLKQKFLKYSDYAKSSIAELFGEKTVAKSQSIEVNTLASSVLWNKEAFNLEPLPNLFQVSSTNKILSDDSGQLWFFGNEYGVTPEIGIMAAHRGIRSSYIDGQFSYEICGVKGQVRDAVWIQTANKKQAILLARTNQPVAYLKK